MFQRLRVIRSAVLHLRSIVIHEPGSPHVRATPCNRPRLARHSTRFQRPLSVFDDCDATVSIDRNEDRETIVASG